MFAQLSDRVWWQLAGRRATSQAAQALLAVLLVLAAGGAVDWLLAIGTIIGGAVYSLVASLVSLPEANGALRSRWRATVYRAVRTAAIALGSILAPAAAAATFDALTFDWSAAFRTVALTVAIAIVKSLIVTPLEAKAFPALE